MKKKRKIKKQSILIICGIVVLLIILFCIITFNRNNKIQSNNIIGSWTIDNVTIYEFYKDDKGKLKVSLNDYSFTFQINNDVINIDFDDDSLLDSEYTFVIENDKLKLSGINGEFEFSRIN